jgi:hypothetical protein
VFGVNPTAGYHPDGVACSMGERCGAIPAAGLWLKDFRFL